MNTKISFLLILILLVVLMLFYYIDLESNLIILLAVTILILLHNIIKKSEHFNVNERAAALDSKINVLLTIAKALQSRSSSSSEGGATDPGMQFNYSCPFAISRGGSDEATDYTTQVGDNLTNQGINLGFNSGIGNITPDQLISSLG